MNGYIKNIPHGEALVIKNEITYGAGQVVSKTLAQNKHHSITLFAFDQGEEISSHASDGDAMVLALDGTGKITIEGKSYILHEGEMIVMPAQKPHAVYAEEQFKMLLIVIFPEQ